MQRPVEVQISGEADMLVFGQHLADASLPGNVFFFQGELGVGKTTLARGFLRACGHKGAVKSPTYTLVEHYALAAHTVFHFDLYRLLDAEELEYMGGRDYFNQQSICLIEWAENGAGFLPEADLVIKINYKNTEQRSLKLVSESSEGQRILHILQPFFGLHHAKETE